jgi:hypothetical protein
VAALVQWLIAAPSIATEPDKVERAFASEITVIHVGLDNRWMHEGKSGKVGEGRGQDDQQGRGFGS